MIEPFIVIRNFISPDRAMSLGKEYMKYCSDVNEEGDEFVPLSHSTYGYITFFELLFEKLPEVQELMGETLFPTYAYSRVYKKNAILEGHKDRSECEVSLTVHLSSDCEWEIWVKDGDVKNNINLLSKELQLGQRQVSELLEEVRAKLQRQISQKAGHVIATPENSNLYWWLGDYKK